MSSCRLMSPGVRCFLVFSTFGFKLLPLAFSLILTVASRLLHLYSTDDKTSRLMVKRFSTMRDTLRGSQRRDSTWRREKGESKGGESNLASDQICKCLFQPGTPGEIH